jgi:hypothetical protein
MTKRRRRRSNLGRVDHIPADFTARVMHLHEARSCAEAAEVIEDARDVLRQLRRKGRMPNPSTMASWNRSLKAFKKTCRRK